MTKRRERTEVLLNLMDAPQTSFRWNGKEENVAKASPETFDAWISQYVEEITDVDRATWEIFDRWEIINDFIRKGVLAVQTVEEKASIVELEMESDSEAFSSTENSDKPASDAV